MCCAITEHVLLTIVPTVDMPTPNSSDRVRYSAFVASLQTVMATVPPLSQPNVDVCLAFV